MPAVSELGENKGVLTPPDNGKRSFEAWLPKEWTWFDFTSEISAKLKEKFPQAANMVFEPQEISNGVYTPAKITYENGLGSLIDSMIIVGDQVTKAEIVTRPGTSQIRGVYLRDVGIPYIEGNELMHTPTQRDGSMYLDIVDMVPVSGGKTHYMIKVEAQGEEKSEFTSGFLATIDDIVVSYNLNPRPLPPPYVD